MKREGKESGRDKEKEGMGEEGRGKGGKEKCPHGFKLRFKSVRLLGV